MIPIRISGVLAGVALMSALVLQGCITEEEKLMQEVMRQVPELGTYGNDSLAVEKLERLGPRALPYVAEALLKPDVTPAQRFWLISVLRGIRDRRAIPALVKVADASPVAEVTEDIVKADEGPEKISLRARRAIAWILDPTPGRFGPYHSSFPDPYPPETVAVQKSYYTNLNAWYVKWRPTYDESEYLSVSPRP